MAQTKVQLLQPNLGDVIDFDSSTLFMDGADNRVGIRNTNPQYELDVTGTINATNFRGNISVGTIDDWITHTGDTNTKLGFPAADTFSVETAGQQNVQVDGTRVLLKSPAGTNTTVRLQHQGNSGYGDIILDRTVNAFIIDNDPSNASTNQSYFSVKNKGTENLRILHNGRVGIASAIATAPLNVQAETSTGTCVRLNQETTSKKASIYFQDATTTGNDSWIINENYDLNVYAGYGGKLNLGVYNKTGITVLSTGKIGIGTVTPGKQLHVFKSNEHPLLLERGDSANTQVELRTGGAIRGYWGCSTTANFMVYDNDASDINFVVNQTGNVGINQSNPGDLLEINPASNNDGLTIKSTGAIYPAITGNTNRTGADQFLLNIRGMWNDTTVANILLETGSDTTNKDDGVITFRTASAGSPAERLRINSSGRVLVGVTASRSVGTATAHKIQVEAVDATAGVTVMRCNAGTTGPYLSFGKSRAASLGDNTVVQSGDSLGMIRFAGADGTDTQNVGAQIQAFVDGTPGSNDMPGRIVFATTADGANTATERLRITSGGQLCLGTTSGPGQIGLYLGDGTNPAGHIYANGTHHMYILANAYHDGAWKYLGNGEAQSISIADGEFNFHTAGNNTSGAGNGVSWQTRFTISSNQNIYIWGNETGNNRAILYNGSGYFGIYGSSSNSVARQLRFHTGGGSASERMRLSSDGFFLVNCQDTGFSSGYTDMTIGNTSAQNTGLTIASSASNGYSRLHFADGNSGAARYAGWIVYDHANDQMKFSTGNSGSYKIAIDTNGTLGIGAATPTFSSPTPSLNIEKASTGSGPVISLYNSQSANAASTCDILVRQNYRDSNRIIFGRENANNWQSSAASVASFTAFHTNNGSGIAEKMRITSGGQVAINNTDPQAGAKLDVRGVTFLSDDIGSVQPSSWANHRQLIVYTSTNGQPITNTNCARVLIATDAKQTGAQGYHGSIDFGSSDCSASNGSSEYNWRTAAIMCRGDGDTSPSVADGDLQFFTKTASGVLAHRFDIAPNGTLTGTDTDGIGSLSDQRLKTNIQDYTYDLNKFKQLKTRTFDWINPEFHQEGNIRGFIAQEIDTVDNYWNYQFEVAKESCEKDYDLLDDGGEDYTIREHRPARASKLNGKDTMYVSVIQQLMDKIETLEAKVAALEGS